LAQGVVHDFPIPLCHVIASLLAQPLHCGARCRFSVMSFGVYRPSMGVHGGHRELCSNQSLMEQRRMGEQMRREDNPITHEPRQGVSGRPPSGNLHVGCAVPASGPLDHFTLPDKDVPAKRPDPTRNASANFATGMPAVPISAEPAARPTPSRMGESCLGEGVAERAPTPDRSSRRSTPGQVVRASSRPKDNLYGGGLTVCDRGAEHPMTLPRKAGSGAPGCGSGGVGNLVAGPNGFVPIGQENFAASGTACEAQRPSSRNSSPFRRMCGLSVA